MTFPLGRCPVCQEPPALEWVPGTIDVPLHCNVLFPDEISAKSVPRVPFTLLMCGNCGLSWNGSYDERLMQYVPGYENSLHFSAAFGTYAAQLATKLCTCFDLGSGTVVEVGCGAGDFLEELVNAGAANAKGFDPSLPSTRISDRLQLFDRLASASDLAGARLVVNRHVLEHVAQPLGLLRVLAAPQAPLYLEVPRAEYMYASSSYWDLVYEHVSYFSAPAIQTAVRSVSAGTIRLQPSFGGQFWSAFVTHSRRPRANRATYEPAAAAETLLDEFSVFGAGFAVSREYWDEAVERLARDGDVVLWGAGSKGVTFLNLVSSARRVAAAVDVNPRKHGSFVAGTGHPIVAPEALTALRPRNVLLMNPQYEAEVITQLRALGLSANVVPVLSQP